MQSLQSFFTETFAPLFLRGRSERTCQLYATSLRTFEKFLGRESTLADLTDETVARFLYWFRRLPRSPYSVNKERSNLLAIWRFACRKKFVEVWPDVKADIEPKRVPQAWTADELERLFAAIDKEAGWIAGVPAAAWWEALHRVAWDSGERIAAIMALQWSNLDLRGGWLRVPAEVRKGKREDRVFRLAADTLVALKAIRHPPRDAVFPWPFNPSYLWPRYAKILKRAGLPADRKSKFHRMRRSVASHYEAAGHSATELLGHSARRVTMAYLDPRIVAERHASDVLFRPHPRVG